MALGDATAVPPSVEWAEVPMRDQLLVKNALIGVPSGCNGPLSNELLAGVGILQADKSNIGIIQVARSQGLSHL